MIPVKKRKNYLEVKQHLQECFRPIDIEELKGVEFDMVQRPLGLKLQKLGHKQFPNISRKDFDSLLKWRFFQD